MALFKGAYWHTSRWNWDFTGAQDEDEGKTLPGLHGLRVGIIGTGASAVQVTPPMAGLFSCTMEGGAVLFCLIVHPLLFTPHSPPYESQAEYDILEVRGKPPRMIPRAPRRPSRAGHPADLGPALRYMW